MDDVPLVSSIPADIVVIIRPRLKRACCEGDACRAAIFNQLLYCIAWKRKYDKEYWYGSYEEIHTKLVDESWGLSKVIKETKILIEQGFVEQRRNPTKGWDQTRQYLFGKEQAKKFREACKKANIVCIEHQMGFPPDVIHLLKSTNAIDKNNKCSCQIQQIDSANSTNASVENNDAIPKTPPEDTQRNGRKNGTSIHSSTLSSFSLEKVREYAEGYGNDVPYCQGRVQQIYQQYVVSDEDFYNYLIEAYRRSEDMAGLFTRLQIMLVGDFAKREQ
jgi:hypothetical protein